MRALLAIVLLLPLSANAAFEIFGIALGASEAQIKRQLPSAHCKKLEWESRAADRRCDDSRVAFSNVEARVTFYLRRDKVEAFDVRFDPQKLDPAVAYFKKLYGEPASEQRDTLGDKKPRVVYKALWEGKGERAALVAQMDKRRASMLVSRGNFEEEIYKVR